MLTQIATSVFCWSEMHGAARSEPYPWNSYVIPVPDREVLVLVDPLPLSAKATREVEGVGIPTHILLTNNYHFRESEVYRQKWGCEIQLHEYGLKAAEAPIDRALQDGDVLWDKIEVFHIPDASFADEVSFLVQEEGGTLIVGDALCGGRKDRGVPDGSLWINGPEYFPDLQRARCGLRRLRERSFDRLCLGHGTPITQAASEIFAEFIENDVVWSSMKAEQVERASPHSREFLRRRAANSML